MIAVDTNILVRYFADDDPLQSELARQLLEDTVTSDAPAYVTMVALVELIWVLEDIYKVTPASIRDIVAKLLVAPQILVEQADAVDRALKLKHADLADSLIHETGKALGCRQTLTFDKKFARLAGVALLV